ncbi:AAA family ATPase [Zavarzinia sp. CC-PAN008]|uniref:AAA family ATPase n=1 Tax=Zavarzinia sp. CC-PAN008 TaxID=3243332 RepID=UPI003F7472B2
MTLALVIGKFAPPHAGHGALLAFARAHADSVAAVVFGERSHGLALADRVAWLRALAPFAAVHGRPDPCATDWASEAAWRAHVDCILSALGVPPDLVVSSEPYGAELARRLGARHLAFDPGRGQVPVSASAIRADPFGHRAFVPPAVLARYTLRVAIHGGECAGKTTLARALADALACPWVPEFARTYIEGGHWRQHADDFVAIAAGHDAAEAAAAADAPEVLVLDTTLVETAMWQRRYFGAASAALDAAAVASLSRHQVHLLCAPDFPAEADPIRDSATLRQAQFAELHGVLAAGGTAPLVLAGPHGRRLATALDHVRGRLAAPRVPGPRHDPFPSGLAAPPADRPDP